MKERKDVSGESVIVAGFPVLSLVDMLEQLAAQDSLCNPATFSPTQTRLRGRRLHWSWIQPMREILKAEVAEEVDVELGEPCDADQGKCHISI